VAAPTLSTKAEAGLFLLSTSVLQWLVWVEVEVQQQVEGMALLCFRVIVS
jgi:hypothetical protein